MGIGFFIHIGEGFEKDADPLHFGAYSYSLLWINNYCYQVSLTTTRTVSSMHSPKHSTEIHRDKNPNRKEIFGQINISNSSGNQKPESGVYVPTRYTHYFKAVYDIIPTIEKIAI